ncbi:MAG TPA: TetR/AcrR family transcriptional regulator [Edaphobacter sp.]|nr:TetR/AcrR family transcriptional regulator [Edaphobacter sp.]
MPNEKKPRPGRGRPPLDAHERRRILDGISAVFLEKGYERASTTEFARRARTSKQTLYGMFPSKADMFLAVMSRHTDQLFAEHHLHIASPEPIKTVLTQMGEKILRMFTAPEFLALYRIVVAEAPRFPELAQRLWISCADHGHSLLAELLRSRAVGGPDYRKSGIQFVTFILGDVILNSMLNPQAQLTESAIQAHVQEAVDDFLTLHTVSPSRKKELQYDGDLCR